MTAYRFPAEWERHEATWLVWPHNEATWPDCLDGARAAFAEMIRVIARAERVDVCVLNRDAADSACSFLRTCDIDVNAVRFHVIPTNDSWVRDYGPLWVRSATKLVALDWRFNAWGRKYPPWDNDDAAGGLIAQIAGHPTDRREVILEGGSIDSDGAGCFLSTRQNIDEPNRGEGRGSQFLATFASPLGIKELILLDEGITGDDTDGHVDDITRFAPKRTIVTAIEADHGDKNHGPLQQNLETLRRETERTGHRLVEIPMPEPLYDRAGHRLPASYANFFICNAAVLMPTFDQPSDAIAQSVLQDLFDDRPVVSVDARTLIVGLGACHCLTLQQPAR